MDFKEQLLLLADRVAKNKEAVKTEEAVKTSFVLPFLQALGYDVSILPRCCPNAIATTERRRARRSTIW